MKLRDIKLTPATHFIYYYLDTAKKFYPLMDVILEEVCDGVEAEGPNIDDLKLYQYVKLRIDLLHKTEMDAFKSYIEKEIHAVFADFEKEIKGDLKVDFKNLIQIDFYKGIKCFAITVPKSSPKLIQDIATLLYKKLYLRESEVKTGFCSILVNFDAVLKSIGALKPVFPETTLKPNMAKIPRVGIEKIKKESRETMISESDEIRQFLDRHFGSDYFLAKPDAIYRLKINSLENFRDKYVAKLNSLLNGAIKPEHYSIKDTKYIRLAPEVVAIIKQKNSADLADQDVLAAQVMLKDKLPLKFA